MPTRVEEIEFLRTKAEELRILAGRCPAPERETLMAMARELKQRADFLAQQR